MKRLLVIPVVTLALSACGAGQESAWEQIIASPAHGCLLDHGYTPQSEGTAVVTYTDPSGAGEPVTLAQIDGVVQPTTPGSLDAYVALGCR